MRYLFSTRLRFEARVRQPLSILLHANVIKQGIIRTDMLFIINCNSQRGFNSVFHASLEPARAKRWFHSWRADKQSTLNC